MDFRKQPNTASILSRGACLLEFLFGRKNTALIPQERIPNFRRKIGHAGPRACTTPLFKRQQMLDGLWTVLPASLHQESAATAPHLHSTCHAHFQWNPENAWNAPRPTGAGLEMTGLQDTPHCFPKAGFSLRGGPCLKVGQRAQDEKIDSASQRLKVISCYHSPPTKTSIAASAALPSKTRLAVVVTWPALSPRQGNHECKVAHAPSSRNTSAATNSGNKLANCCSQTQQTNKLRNTSMLRQKILPGDNTTRRKNALKIASKKAFLFGSPQPWRLFFLLRAPN